ncbi:SDR family NAD(P)-dependent oxidoreductase [Salmonella enterica subsp. enterica serovar Infantis]|nr:SDR family NAD(P)-dependent oxidoreductase [Salmonella enterica subsp. enterica serovar Infantis]
MKNITVLAEETPGIAIIGMSGRFPGAGHIDILWNLLLNGDVPLHEISDDELEEQPPQKILQHPDYVRKRFILKDIDKFDARFFGYSPREASQLDPQQRLFLQTAWHSLENSGYAADKTAARIGVYGSANFNTYAPLDPHWPDLGESAAYMDRVLATDKDYLASRCAYKMDLRGPAITVQTACSSSLTAVVLACHELLTYGCDMALAGGAGVSAHQYVGYQWHADEPLARHGLCLPFDARATGMIDSSGVAVVVLKRVEEALRDGDTIYAVIAGTGMSNDGSRKSSFTAPGVAGQVEAIRAALSMAGLSGGEIGYVETHGTGTPMGDPVEVAAIKQALGEQGPSCVLGALKANIGHMGAAAGIGGLIKAALIIHHQKIPPHPDFLRPNPECRLEQSRFCINQEMLPWEGTHRYAGVSSFGLGGSNVHIILRPAPVPKVRHCAADQDVLIGLSAQNEGALQQMRNQLVRVLSDTDIPLNDISHTLDVGRKDFNYRLAVCGHNRENLLQALHKAPIRQVNPLKTVWLFPGAGTRTVGIGSTLYRKNARFRSTVDNICQQALNLSGCDARHIILARSEDPATDSVEATLIALFAVEMALAYELQYLGIVPDVILGHSFGEYAVACLAEVFDIPTAITIICQRARLLARSAPGGMLAIPASVCCDELLARFGVEVAATNSPEQVVVAGALEAIEALQTQLKREGSAVTRLPVLRAGHSALLDPLLPEFAQFLAGCTLSPAKFPFVSGCTGEWVDQQQVATVEYWVRHMRNAVNFTRGLETVFNEGTAFLIEVGPGRGLCSLVRQHPGMSTQSIVLPAVGGNNDRNWNTLLAELWSYGRASVLPARLLGPGSWRRVPLPGYAFCAERYWQTSVEPRGLTTRRRRPCEQWLVHPVWNPYPSGHITQQTGKRHLLLGKTDALSMALRQRLEVLGAEVTQCETSDAEVIWILWPLQLPEKGSLSSLAYCQTLILPMFERLLALIRQQILANQGRGMQFILLGCGLMPFDVDEQPVAELALLQALVRTLPHEIPDAVCRCVDLSTPDDGELASSVELLLTLLSTPAPQTPLEQNFAIRHNRLWRREYLEAPEWQTPDQTAEPIVAGKCYLILGGSGGIGTSLAHALAERSAAHISLVGHKPLIGERLSQFTALKRQLQEHDTRLHYFQTDAGNPDALYQAFHQAVTQMEGQLHGVIHAAGVVGGGLIQAELPQDEASNLGVKIFALLALEPLLQERELDFLILCSSLGAHTGAAGQLDNVMGNSFFDSYACAGRLPRCRQVLSIGWDYWQEVGMIKNLEIRHRELTGEAIQHGMTPQEGAAWFLRLLGSPWHQVLLSTLPLSELRGELRQRLQSFIGTIAAAVPQPISQQRSRMLDTSPVAPANVLEQLLCYLWQEHLGLDQVGCEDNYLDLGGDSLRALSLLGTMKEALNTDISVRALYQYPTPAGLATWLLTNNESPPLLTRAQLYLEVCAMPEEEVQRALQTSGEKE